MKKTKKQKKRKMGHRLAHAGEPLGGPWLAGHLLAFFTSLACSPAQSKIPQATALGLLLDLYGCFLLY